MATITGTSARDILEGTMFADEIFGLGGDDLIRGSPGADTINGDSELDAVDYLFFNLPVLASPLHSNSVDVDLERSVQSGGHAEGDVLINVENVSGSDEDDAIRGDDEENDLRGNGGSDTIDGRDGDDVILGDGSHSFLSGVAGNDILDGGAGNDTLIGSGGSDTLTGGHGIDLLDGGAGVDTVSYANSAAAVTIALAGAGGIAFGVGGDAAGDALLNIENATGSAFADALTGTSVANALDGGIGNDTLVGLGGGDILNGSSGTDSTSYAASGSGVVVDLSAGTGTGGDAEDDELFSIENVTGSNFTDALYGSALGNVLDGGAGTDVLVGRGGSDIYIVDNAGDAVVEAASQGSDEVRTSVSYTLGSGQDIETLRTTNDNGTAAINLTGNSSGNQIIGNNGDNVINGGVGVDQLVGRNGNDLYVVDNAADSITENGGQGIDEVRTSVSYVLTAGADIETLATVNDNATTAIDLTGNVSGNAVRGNNGTNAINGGDGDDILTGRGGADAFVFDTALNAANNVDEITDFNVTDDTIQLQNAVFTGLAGGTLGANQFVIGAAAQDADDRIVYDNTSGALSFDVDGTGGAAAVQFAQLTAGLALTNADFLVF